MNRKLSRLIVAILFLCMILSACSSGVTPDTPTPTSAADAGSSDPTDTPANDPSTQQAPEAGTDPDGAHKEPDLSSIICNMTMDEKISQMIIPAIRSWNDAGVTDLSAVPELAAALKKHQYGGVILFGSNITDNEQVAKLLSDLQENNRLIDGVSAHIPYLTPVDEEGGIVIRLMSGTRMTGNMAIGATADAEANAEKTGTIIGEELAAIGFNADYAPDIDVNNNPSNPVIGTRSFSDDPQVVAKLGRAYSKGLAKSNIIATYKHFPGHGDTATDSHIGTPSVEKTYEEIKATELIPFKEAIDGGADMIMTAHITYPLIDDEVTFGDGVTKGYFPATMSKKMVTDILRTDLGFDGVVVTDALEMDAIRTAGLVEGAEDSVEYAINIAKEVIGAGVDILLIPLDITNPEAVAFYDEYIKGLSDMAESGAISSEMIDESVKRILALKVKYGIFDPDSEGPSTANDARDLETVGSKAHHDAELEMARQAITLLKNEDELVPLSKDRKSIVFLGRLASDATTIEYAVQEMRDKGFAGEDAEITVDFYYDSSAEVKLHYPDDLKEKISNADVVIAFSYASGSPAYDRENPQFIGLHNALRDVHEGGGKFILLSENLPYDAAVYQDADAIVLAYMGSGLGIDPTDKTANDTFKSAVNSNIIAAIETIFGANSARGKLPVNIPSIVESGDGLSYGTDILYERGTGLTTAP